MFKSRAVQRNIVDDLTALYPLSTVKLLVRQSWWPDLPGPYNGIAHIPTVLV